MQFSARSQIETDDRHSTVDGWKRFKPAQDWLDMIGGKLNGQMAFMSGKLKLKGDMGFAMKMGSLFSV